MQSNTAKKQAEQEIARRINEERLVSIAKGFQEMAQIVIDKIEKGSDIAQVKTTCEWYINKFRQSSR